MRWAIFAACFILQLAWGDLLGIQGRSPDLLLLGILWAAAPLAPWGAALFGFAAGLAADLTGALDPLGAAALAGTSAGFFASLFLHPALRLPLWRTLLRLALILGPLDLFLAHVRYSGMDYDAWDITLRLALPVWLYTVALGVLLSWLWGGRRGDQRR